MVLFRDVNMLVHLWVNWDPAVDQTLFLHFLQVHIKFVLNKSLTMFKVTFFNIQKYIAPWWRQRSEKCVGKKPRHLPLGKVLEDFHYQASSGDGIVFNHFLFIELVSFIFFNVLFWRCVPSFLVFIFFLENKALGNVTLCGFCPLLSGFTQTWQGCLCTLGP